MPGSILIAPEGRQLEALPGGAVRATSRKPRGVHLPSADTLLSSWPPPTGGSASALSSPGWDRTAPRGSRHPPCRRVHLARRTRRRASFFGMPREAVRRGAVDQAMAPASMAELLRRMAERSARPEGAVVPDAFRILLVDDSETVTEMLSRLLGSAGYAIETAGDGVKGVQAAFRRVPDLVVMSTRLPRLDGIQACRLLKAEPATRDVPVILLTSEEAGGTGSHAVRAGADRCLLRDVSRRRPCSRSGNALRGRAPRPEGGADPGSRLRTTSKSYPGSTAFSRRPCSRRSLLNEIARVGREVDDFEATARSCSDFYGDRSRRGDGGGLLRRRVLGGRLPSSPTRRGDPFRRRSGRGRSGSATRPAFRSPRPRCLDRHPGGFRGSDGVAPGSLAPRAVCTVRAGKWSRGL